MDQSMSRASNQPRDYSRREVLRLAQSAGSSLLFGLSGALTFPAVAEELSPRDAAVDRLITQAMEDQHISGLSMAVLKNGSLLRSAGYGQFDRKLGLPTAASTVFRIGSLSKQFLASAIMLLLQRQALVLDTPVREYLPTAPQLWNRISVRHLLSHTSGLIREAPGYNKDRLQDDATVIKSAYEEPLLFAPGNSYSYSNLGYFILAEMITRISKQKWWNFVQEQIFKDVGMVDTQPMSVAPTAAFVSGYRWREGR